MNKDIIAVSHRKRQGRPTKDLSGIKFGKLLPKELEYRPTSSGNNMAWWRCICDYRRGI